MDASRKPASARPEIELLLCCARAQTEPTLAERIRGLLEGPIDWGLIQELAVFHRIGPLLYRCLAESSADLVPTNQLEHFRLFQRYKRGVATRIPAHLGAYRGTPVDMVERMLAFAEVGPEDVVYDLGCGDGRIVIAAAKQRGAKGVGVDVDPNLLAQAKTLAREERVEHFVRFLEQDAKEADLSEATVVTLCVLEAATIRLRQKLRTELRSGARVVSRHCDMGDWNPLRHEVISSATGISDTFFLWRIE